MTMCRVDDPDWVATKRTRLDWRPISMGISKRLLAGIKTKSITPPSPKESPSLPSLPQYKAAGLPMETAVAPFGRMIFDAVSETSSVLNFGYVLTFERSCVAMVYSL